MLKTPVLLYFIVCKMYCGFYDKRNTNQNMLDETKNIKNQNNIEVYEQ